MKAVTALHLPASRHDGCFEPGTLLGPPLNRLGVSIGPSPEGAGGRGRKSKSIPMIHATQETDRFDSCARRCRTRFEQPHACKVIHDSLAVKAVTALHLPAC